MEKNGNGKWYSSIAKTYNNDCLKYQNLSFRQYCIKSVLFTWTFSTDEQLSFRDCSWFYFQMSDYDTLLTLSRTQELMKWDDVKCSGLAIALWFVNDRWKCIPNKMVKYSGNSSRWGNLQDNTIWSCKSYTCISFKVFYNLLIHICSLSQNLVITCTC